MKVLHIYSQDNPRLAMYVNLLSQAMPADVECVFADNAADFNRAIRDFQPDIVHQHGRFPVVADNESPRLVVSPHGEVVGTHRAYAIIARSPYEMNSHKTTRKVLVQNPLITKTITFERAAAAICTLYRRVLDSNPLEFMNVDTRYLLAVMLKAGLLGDEEWVADCDWQGRVEDCDFRHLFIYADMEGILDMVERGIVILGIDAPEKPVIDCYLPNGYSRPAALHEASVPELLHDIDRHGVTLLRLIELMRALHDDRLDEAALMEEMETEKLRPLLQSLLQLLSEQLLLTEGFMPCTPLDNTLTENLRQQIINHLQIL